METMDKSLELIKADEGSDVSPAASYEQYLGGQRDYHAPGFPARDAQQIRKDEGP